MGEWVIGAFINIFGSIAINFGTNLLKLGHNQRERLALNNNGTNGKLVMKPIISFHSWRVGVLFFALGNCLNFVSFGYAAQSLLAALGSIQFVSNIAFTYFVLKKTVTGKFLVATTFIVLGNIFLVAFGNHQSPVYTPQELTKKYGNLVFLVYCMILMLIVAANHNVYRKGEYLLSVSGHDLRPYWRMLLPFSYATVSGAVGSCSVLFAKSLSNMLRLTTASNHQLHIWFTYSMFLLFFSTAGFWMARLNEGLSLFDAILIVPMFQIAWTFFSICTGFVYFQEYQVFDALRTIMFVLGMAFVFIGISLLAPNDSKGCESKDSLMSPKNPTEKNRLLKLPMEEMEVINSRSYGQAILSSATDTVARAKAACSFSLGLGEDSINASSVLVMPMVSSRMTGFRGTGFDRAKGRNGVESQSARVTFKQPYAQQIALLLNNVTILDRQVRILPDKDDTANTQEQTESMATEQSVVQALRSRGYQMLKRADEAVGNAGSACVTTGALWLSGVFDKASRSTAQLAVNTNNIKKGREADRETTNPRKGK